MTHSGFPSISELIQRKLPPGTLRLLEAAADHAEKQGLRLYTVGGFVRDLLRGTPRLDIDLVVEGDAMAFGQGLVARFGGKLHRHTAFGTGKWIPDDHTAAALNMPGSALPPYFDLVTARAESYSAPAALPTVRPGTLDDDLRRRDFTINTLAVQLAPRPFGALIDRHGGIDDLKQGVIRVLHDASFIDDPTRIFRAARFAERLTFRIEPHTEGLIRAALPNITRLSGERIQNELELALLEALPERVWARLHTLDALGNLNEGLKFDEQIARWFESARTLRETTTWSEMPLDFPAVYWILLTCRLDDPETLGRRLHFDRKRLAHLSDGRQMYLTLPELGQDRPPSEIARLLDGLSDEALVAAEAAAPSPLARHHTACYAFRWRFTYPTLTGHDLRAMGVKPGPRLGRLLARLRAAWLDGQITTPTEEREAVQRWIAETDGAG